MACSPPGSAVLGDSPGKNTGGGCHALVQGISPTQGLNPGLPHCRQILYQLSHWGSSLLNIVNIAALKIGLQMSFYIMVFSGPKAMDGLARSCSNYVSCVSAIFIVLSFIAAPTHLHPRPQCRKISCLPRLPHHLIFVDLLEDGHSEGYALMHRCSFDGRFSN